MVSRRQLWYLDAMGIEVWVPRASPRLSELSPEGAPGAGGHESTANVLTSQIDQFDWPQLEAAVTGCQRCALRQGCRQTVFGVGNRQANWLIVGEAPGAEEDQRGEPFVGRAGQLLNNMLRAIGLERGEVFIANILKCRPPGNRDPAADEAAACAPYLSRQIALLQPRIILAVGRIAAQNLLKVSTPIGQLRGKIHYFGGGRIPAIATYHPAYLLRAPSEKSKAWQDLLLARRVFAAAVNGGSN